MFVPFHTLPDSARIWVYSSERLLTEQELNLIRLKFELFLGSWQSHQQDVRSSYEIKEDRFLIVAVDESYNGISGCGIDKSLHFVQELETELGISLTNKTNVVFEVTERQVVLPFVQIKSAISEGIISTESFYYNTLVSNIGELKTNFKVNVQEGWVKKYFLETITN
jgi:hypothetical protein